MKRLLGLGFWISALYFILYTKIPALQDFVNTPVGPYVHVVMVILLIVGIFFYVLRIIHYLFLALCQIVLMKNFRKGLSD